MQKSLRVLVSTAETLVYVEDLSRRKGFLQSINPLVKLAVTVFMISASVFVSWLPHLVLLCIIPLVFALLSEIPLKGFFARTSIIPLFATVISLPILFTTFGTSFLTADLGLFTLSITFEGLQRFMIFSVRVWFCVASLTLFTLSTGFEAILRLLSSIRIPLIMIQLFSLTYRYLFISIHEIQTVLLAKEARTYMNRQTANLQSLRQSGALLATLFIRTYERSERVYLAMKSRGFEVDNAVRPSIPGLNSWDLLFGVSATFIFGLFVVL